MESCDPRIRSESIASDSSSDTSAPESSSDSSSSGDGFVNDDESDRSTRSRPWCEGDSESNPFTAQVLSWVQQIPLGLGLCPWAIKSQSKNRLKCQVCESTLPSDVANVIRSEAQALCGEGVALWSTTLVACPQVAAWNKDFPTFESFVKSIAKETDLEQQVTLVSFHPQFMRWRSLPKGIGVGSAVESYKGIPGFHKSPNTFFATVTETSNPAFGLRKIKVRFHDDQKEQYVPIEWLVCREEDAGPPLPDNVMHRAPYPTIHLIRNEDLGTLCVRDVSRVKRINSQRLMKLGWEGVRRKTTSSGK